MHYGLCPAAVVAPLLNLVFIGRLAARIQLNENAAVSEYTVYQQNTIHHQKGLGYYMTRLFLTIRLFKKIVKSLNLDWNINSYCKNLIFSVF